MKRNPKPWTKHELALLGTRSDAEVAELTGRTFGTVWQSAKHLESLSPHCVSENGHRPRINSSAPLPTRTSPANLAEPKAPSRAGAPFSSASRADAKPSALFQTPNPLALLWARSVLSRAQPIAVPRDPTLADVAHRGNSSN